jgi:hypothetical protein
MWRRRILGAAAGVVLVLAAGPVTTAEAQVRVGVRVAWDWGTVDVRARDGAGYRARYGADYRDIRYMPVRYVEVAGFRIPRGHRPRPGFCRLWYPGVAPGRQSRPVPCHALRGRFHPDVLVVTRNRVLAPVFGTRRIGYAVAPRVVWRQDRFGADDYRIRWEGDHGDQTWAEPALYGDDRYSTRRPRRGGMKAGSREGRQRKRP